MAPASPTTEDFDDRAAIHEELNKLPDKYRRPVVLCHLEGRSMEDAAALLGWPVGTVKGRLHRARELLKGRLSRRGLAIAPAALGACLSADASAAVPPLLLGTTVKAAMALGAGSAIVAGLGISGAVHLADGVTRTMLATKLKVLLAVGASTLGIAAGGAGVYGRQDGAPAAAKGTAAKVATPNPSQPPLDKPAFAEPPVDIDPSREVVTQAVNNLNSLKDFYENGTVTIDRYLDATRRLMEAQRNLATDKAGRVAALDAHIKRLVAIRDREIAKLSVGTGKLPDVNEAKLSLFEALAMLKSERPGDESRPAAVVAGAGTSSLFDTPKSAAGADEVEAARKRLIDQRVSRLRENFAGRLAANQVTYDGQSAYPGSTRYYLLQLRAYGVKPSEMVADLSSYIEGIKTLGKDHTLRPTGVRSSLDPDNAARARDAILVAELWLAQTKHGEYPELSLDPGVIGSTSPPPNPGLDAKAQPGVGQTPVAPVAPVAMAKQYVLRPTLPPNPDADRNKAIADALEKVVPMDFPKPTELAAVVEYIKKSTISPALPKGIPIFVDSSIANLNPTVVIQLDESRLRTSLRLMLRANNQGYVVDEGLLIISNLDSPLLNPGRGGGMGGSGGGGFQ